MVARKPVRRRVAAKSVPAPAPAKRGRPVGSKNKPKPEAATKARDVTVYADKEPTDYHKAFAQWIVKEVGYRPSQAESMKDAFLMGVSISTVARTAFMESEFLADWREKTGTAKRGPKPTTQKAASKPVVEDDDDFDDEVEDDDDDFDDDESEEDDDDFDEEDEDSDEEESEEDDDDFDDEDEVEETPAPKRRVAAKSTAKPSTRGSRGSTRSATRTAKPATRAKAKPVEDDDDEFAF